MDEVAPKDQTKGSGKKGSKTTQTAADEVEAANEAKVQAKKEAAEASRAKAKAKKDANKAEADKDAKAKAEADKDAKGSEEADASKAKGKAKAKAGGSAEAPDGGSTKPAKEAKAKGKAKGKAKAKAKAKAEGKENAKVGTQAGGLPEEAAQEKAGVPPEQAAPTEKAAEERAGTTKAHPPKSNEHPRARMHTLYLRILPARPPSFTREFVPRKGFTFSQELAWEPLYSVIVVDSVLVASPLKAGGSTSSSSTASEHNNEAIYVLTNYYELLNIPMDATASDAEKVAPRPGVLRLLTPNSVAHYLNGVQHSWALHEEHH